MAISGLKFRIAMREAYGHAVFRLADGAIGTAWALYKAALGGGCSVSYATFLRRLYRLGSEATMADLTKPGNSQHTSAGKVAGESANRKRAKGRAEAEAALQAVAARKAALKGQR